MYVMAFNALYKRHSISTNGNVLGYTQPMYRLTRLELLRDADIFLGHDWLAKRADVLAVYPYHVHMKNLIELFRTLYRTHRSRL